MHDRARTDEQLLDLPDPDALSGEQLDTQVQRAQQTLLELKRQQDAIEKQKRELEELSRRQEQLQQGKGEMIERFTRSMVVLEREIYDAQKRVEQLQSIHEAFTQHLAVLESLNPKAWEGLDMNKELTKALSAVDDARAEFQRALPRISPDSDTSANDPVAATAGFDTDFAPGQNFMYWLKAGFAFTLPLLAILLLIFFMIVGGALKTN